MCIRGCSASKQDRRVDVALMIGTVDRRTIERDMLASIHAEGDACGEEGQPDAEVSERVEQALPPEENRQQHARRTDNEDVEETAT
jgi:hypothetical protein